MRPSKTKPYGADDYNKYHAKVRDIASHLSDKILFAAGSMQWGTNDDKKLFVSALVATKDQVLRYDTWRTGRAPERPSCAGL